MALTGGRHHSGTKIWLGFLGLWSLGACELKVGKGSGRIETLQSSRGVRLIREAVERRLS